MTGEANRLAFIDFDDGSRLWLARHSAETLDVDVELLKRAFSDPDTAQPAAFASLLTAIVDFCWALRQEPAVSGGTQAWTRSYATKADLARQVCRVMLIPLISPGSEVPGDAGLIRQPDASEAREASESGRADKPGGTRGLAAVGREPAVRRIRDRFRSLALQGLHGRAWGLLEAGRLSEAASDWEMCLRLRPDDALAWHGLGIARRRSGAAVRALACAYISARLFRSPYLRTVSCPECGWVPVGIAWWRCEDCGESFDTFETGARCPSCKRTWEHTQCPACMARSSHQRWWRRPGQTAGDLLSDLASALELEQGYQRLEDMPWPEIADAPYEAFDFIGVRRYWGYVVAIGLVRADRFSRAMLQTLGASFAALVGSLGSHGRWLTPYAFGILCFVFESDPPAELLTDVPTWKWRDTLTPTVACWVLDVASGRVRPHCGLPLLFTPFPGSLERYLSSMLARGRASHPFR